MVGQVHRAGWSLRFFVRMAHRPQLAEGVIYKCFNYVLSFTHEGNFFFLSKCKVTTITMGTAIYRFFSFSCCNQGDENPQTILNCFENTFLEVSFKVVINSSSNYFGYTFFLFINYDFFLQMFFRKKLFAIKYFLLKKECRLWEIFCPKERD
jgi:hypothetical protein